MSQRIKDSAVLFEHVVEPYPVLIAAKDPLGMLTEGFFKSPLMLIPAKIPVIVGKNTPKQVNHEFP